MREFHAAGGWVVIVANALAGLYALAAWYWKSLRGRAVWIAVIAAEAVLTVQVLNGTYLVAVDDYEPPDVHMVYGFVSFATIGILYSYKYVWKARDMLELAYGLGGLFLMGMAIRAILKV